MRAYRGLLQDRIVSAVEQALAHLEPVELWYGSGVVPFPMNRRELTRDRGVILGVNPRGPSDRTMPLLKVADANGRIRAVVFGAATHNTTLTQDEYGISGDYAGFAQEYVEKQLPGAQAMFVQFGNIQQALALKIPFGIAQMGKSFRNEVTVEHYIFRSCEFEQMEMEYFVEPGKQKEALAYWKDERLRWYHRYANDPSKFRLRQHGPEELAHYADACYDVEYEYGGQVFHTRLPYDPGERIRVRVAVTPA